MLQKCVKKQILELTPQRKLVTIICVDGGECRAARTGWLNNLARPYSEALPPQGGMLKFFLEPPEAVSPFSIRDWLLLLIHPTFQTRACQNV